MEDKYVIFCKCDPIRPISSTDEKMNNHIIELSKDDAIKLVSEKNKQYGENFYCFEKMNDWQKRLKSPQMETFYRQKDKICADTYEQIMKNDDIRETIEKGYNDIDKNINGFQIPFIADCNEDYEEKLNEKLEAFKKEIVGKPAFKGEGNLVADVSNICDKVIIAFQAAKLGKSEEAEKLVSEILQNYKQYPFAVSELDKSYAFRGLAPFEELRPSWGDKKHYEDMLNGDLSFFRARIVGTKEKIDEMEEINYLPYSKRLLSKDMRFSSKGKVCLYLGTTSYVCSEECRWNEKDNLYLSSFKFNEKGKRLKILNLVVLQALMNGIASRVDNNLVAKNIHNAMIRVFPLVIATMFTIKTSDKDRKEKYHETIKYEYLLSQVLMNVLQKEGIDGVAYLSRQGKDDFQFPQMVCLAIPITDINSENEYGDLINCYEMTKPILINDKMHNEKKSYINEKWPMYYKQKWDNAENINAKVYYAEQEIFYQETPFSKVDDYMVNQEYLDFDGKITWKKWIKKAVKKLSNLWQSEDENFSYMYMGSCLFFVLFCISVFFLLLANNENEIINYITKIIFKYFSIFLSSVSITLLAWGFYVNNSIEKLKNLVWIMLPLIILISLYTFVVGIPFWISIIIIEKIIEMRAKKIDNVVNFLLILVVLFVEFVIFFNWNLSFSFLVVQNVSLELNNICGIKINPFTCILFFTITLCIYESQLTCSGLLKFLNLLQNKSEKQHLKKYEKNLEEFIKEKEKLDEINKRDREYIQNGIKRIWLLILIIIFIAITFNMLPIEGIESYSGDIINVLTVYTLFLLYNDKRKEWK